MTGVVRSAGPPVFVFQPANRAAQSAQRFKDT